MNSCLYETEIAHCRLSPKLHHLKYRFFSFYLDLDELEEVSKKISIIGFNKFNLYSFYDKDHFELNEKPIKEKLSEYLESQGIATEIGSVKLLTYLRTFGFVFNPVSFYFCFDKEQKPLAVVIEIENTFREIKPFVIKDDKFDGTKYIDQQIKYYYVSPFTDLDDSLDFRVAVPGESLDIGVDTSKFGKKYMIAQMSGQRKELTFNNLLWCTFKFPLVTLSVIVLIHWHAFLLYLKKVPFHQKENDLHLQKGVYRERYKN